MVRKTRSQQYQADDDYPATKQSINDLQAQVTELVAAVAHLTTQQAMPSPRHERADRTYDSDGDDNPFAPLRRQQERRINRNNTNNSDSEEDHNDNAWKKSFKLKIPEFKGSTVAEELLDWFVTVEEILEFKQVPLERCAPLVAIRFRDRAAAWWSQVKATRSLLGKSKITSWDKLKKEMQKNFLPYNFDQLMFQKFQNLRQGTRTVDEYATEFFKMINRVEVRDTEDQLVMRFIGGLRQQIQYTLNLFQPQTISEAHQQALTIEAQSRTGLPTWNSSRLNRQSSTPATALTN